MNLLNGRALATAAAAIILVWVVGKLVAFFQDRWHCSKLPGPPHSLVFGHLIALGKVAAKLPGRAHPHTLPAQLMREHDLPPIFYLDTRPVGSTTMVIADPDVAHQVAEAELAKPAILADVVKSLVGTENILITNGPLWKKWRGAFNPGFSIQHVAGQIPTIVDCCHDFVRILDEHSSADRVFRMEEEATKITVDVIGKVVCGYDFKCLSSGSRFVDWMRISLAWSRDVSSINPLHVYSVVRPIVQKYYRVRLTRYLGRILDDRFATTRAAAPMTGRKRTGVDLALELYAKENREQVDASATTMNAEFRKHAIDNLLTLLFGGHDTSSSTLCYCYHLLWKHPETLAAARKELDGVFGVDISAADQLRENPFLVNKLHYLLAVIKEVLRMWPPASAAKQGRKDLVVRDPTTGEMCPTEGMTVWINHLVLGRSSKIWGDDVDDFKPERFLPENVAKLPAHAWRPFEAGSRNCIGQELALMELKTVLALTLREFDIRSAFDELTSVREDGSFWTKDGSFRKGPQKVFGDEMYQVLLLSAKPNEGMPARVKRRKAF